MFTRQSRTTCELAEGSRPAAPAPHPLDVWSLTESQQVWPLVTSLLACGVSYFCFTAGRLGQLGVLQSWDTGLTRPEASWLAARPGRWGGEATSERGITCPHLGGALPRSAPLLCSVVWVDKQQVPDGPQSLLKWCGAQRLPCEQPLTCHHQGAGIW